MVYTETGVNAGGTRHFDLQAGALYENWKVNLYVNNLTDSRGEIGGGASEFPSTAITLITPRTIGVNLIRTF